MNEKQKVIYEIQDYLRNISDYNENIPFVASDGIYGDETSEAVKIFQQEYGIEESGRVDLETFTKLTEINALATQQLLYPFPSQPSPENMLPLKIGDSGIFVSQLNMMLGTIAAAFSNFSSPANTDFFGAETEKQVRRWQRITAVSPTGQVDKATWNSLADFYLL